MHKKVIEFNQKQRADEIPSLQAGDTIRVHRKIKEENKERVQIFEGTVLALKGGQSSSPMVTVRKVSSGVGVELIIPLYSPSISKIELVRRAKTRRSKVYFLRTKSEKEIRRKLREIPLASKNLSLKKPTQEENVQELEISQETQIPSSEKQESKE